MLSITSNTKERRFALMFYAPEGVTSKAHHAAVKAAMNSISFYAKGWRLKHYTTDRYGNEGRFSTVCVPQKWLPKEIRIRLLESRSDISRVYKNKLKRV